MTGTAAAALTVLAEANWPGPGEDTPAQLPGFVQSTFSPVVAEVANRCLAARHEAPPAPAAVADRTAIVLVSASGDLAGATQVAAAVDTDGRIGPLLFYQSVPNSVAGHVATRWGLGGPVVCRCPLGDPLADGMAQARLLIDDGAADEVLVVAVEQTRDGAEGTTHARAVLASEGERR